MTKGMQPSDFNTNIETLIDMSPIPNSTKEKLRFILQAVQGITRPPVPVTTSKILNFSILDGYAEFPVPSCPLPYAASVGAVAPGMGQSFRGTRDSWNIWDSHSPIRYGFGLQVDEACKCLGYDGAYWDVQDSGTCYSDRYRPCVGDVITTGNFGAIGGAERYVWKRGCPMQCEPSTEDGEGLLTFKCLSPIRLWDVVKLPYEYVPHVTRCRADQWVDLPSAPGLTGPVDMVKIAQCMGYEAPWVQQSVYISPKVAPAYYYDFPLGGVCPSTTRVSSDICLVTHLKVLRPLDTIINWLVGA